MRDGEVGEGGDAASAGDTGVPVDLPGAVNPPTIGNLPTGFVYGVTRYADVILAEAFPVHLGDILRALEGFDARLPELQASGGNRTPFVERFDSSLASRGWGKRTIVIGKTIDDEPISRARGHEIDMFKVGIGGDPYPGIATEMEWSNKDPFFDRDLLNFQALHREGALAVGVLVTRGPTLHKIIKRVVRSADGEKYGESTTHWSKLVERVNLGGGGECPLFLVGIEPERIRDFDPALRAYDALVDADLKRKNWRDEFTTHGEALAAHAQRRASAFALMPPAPPKEGTMRR